MEITVFLDFFDAPFILEEKYKYVKTIFDSLSIDKLLIKLENLLGADILTDRSGDKPLSQV